MAARICCCPGAPGFSMAPLGKMPRFAALGKRFARRMSGPIIKGSIAECACPLRSFHLCRPSKVLQKKLDAIPLRITARSSASFAIPRNRPGASQSLYPPLPSAGRRTQVVQRYTFVFILQRRVIVITVAMNGNPASLCFATFGLRGGLAIIFRIRAQICGLSVRSERSITIHGPRRQGARPPAETKPDSVYQPPWTARGRERTLKPYPVLRRRFRRKAVAMRRNQPAPKRLLLDVGYDMLKL